MLQVQWISSGRSVVPCSRLAVVAEQRCSLFGLFDSFRSELVYLRRYTLQVQDFLLHEAVDDPVTDRVKMLIWNPSKERYSPACDSRNKHPTNRDRNVQYLGCYKMRSQYRGMLTGIEQLTCVHV